MIISVWSFMRFKSLIFGILIEARQNPHRVLILNEFSSEFEAESPASSLNPSKIYFDCSSTYFRTKNRHFLFHLFLVLSKSTKQQ